MRIIQPSKEWKEYIKFTDKCINYNFVNEYTLSNFFLHPTRPLIQTIQLPYLVTKLKTQRDMEL